MNTDKKREDVLTMELLDAVQKQSDLSQRHLARHLGVALGLANSYLKRCVRKGLIKITEAPANRYFYYLTPKGFAEKSRLTAQYLSYSLSFYRSAADSCNRVFATCQEQGWKRLLLCGVSDLAEIATLRALEWDLTIIGYSDSQSEHKKFLGRPVWIDVQTAEASDVCIITDTHTPQQTYKRLLGCMNEERILIPDILRLDKENRD